MGPLGKIPLNFHNNLWPIAIMRKMDWTSRCTQKVNLINTRLVFKQFGKTFFRTLIKRIVYIQMIVSLFSTWFICHGTKIWCCGLCRKRTLSTWVYWQTNVWATWWMRCIMVSGNWDPEQCTAKWAYNYRSWRLEQKYSLKYVFFFRFNFPDIFFLFRKSSFP